MRTAGRAGCREELPEQGEGFSGAAKLPVLQKLLSAPFHTPFPGWEPGDQQCWRSRRQLCRLQAGAQPRQRSFCSHSCSNPFRSSWYYKHLLGTWGLLWLLGFCLPWQLHSGVRSGRAGSGSEGAAAGSWSLQIKRMSCPVPLEDPRG